VTTRLFVRFTLLRCCYRCWCCTTLLCTICYRCCYRLPLLPFTFCLLLRCCSLFVLILLRFTGYVPLVHRWLDYDVCWMFVYRFTLRLLLGLLLFVTFSIRCCWLRIACGTLRICPFVVTPRYGCSVAVVVVAVCLLRLRIAVCRYRPRLRWFGLYRCYVVCTLVTVLFNALRVTCRYRCCRSGYRLPLPLLRGLPLPLLLPLQLLRYTVTVVVLVGCGCCYVVVVTLICYVVTVPHLFDWFGSPCCCVDFFI